jgi:hypothetical protein
MYADVNRNNLDPKNTHFSQLLHHQGRVLLPSDLNEHGAIFQYYLRQFIIDFVGQRWRAGENYFIVKVNNNGAGFTITQGHFYVDGILCVNESDCLYSGAKQNTSGSVQPRFPTPEWELIKGNGFPKSYAVYLECWERHVNSIQRPEIVEVALGGPDASSRMEIAWQVRILTNELAESYFKPIGNAQEKGKTEITKVINDTLTNFKNAIDPNQTTTDKCKHVQDLIDLFDVAEPKLRVWAKKPQDTSDSCSISPDSQYRGLENQLYRVEIHSPGVLDKEPAPSFKWSRENGSVVFAIVSDSVSVTESNNVLNITLELEKLGPDRRYGLCVNDWIELTNDSIEYSQKFLPLLKITKVDSNLGRLVLSTSYTDKIKSDDFVDCTLLRRWDQNDSHNKLNNYGAIDITEGDSNKYDANDWIELEYGIKVQFQKGGYYRKGDYWLIPARVATGDLEWPKEENNFPKACPTDGVKRHRAALGVVIDG